MPRSQVRTATTLASNACQEWLQERFQDLTPEDLSNNALAMYAVEQLAAPSGFHRVWQPIRDHHRLGGSVPFEEEQLLHSVRVVLVFANVDDKPQLRSLRRLICFFHSFFRGRRCPQLILVQHSVKPSLRHAANEDARFQAMVHLSENGLSHFVIDEKQSFVFAWDVRKQIRQSKIVQQEQNECFLAKRALIKTKQEMKWLIDKMLWEYLRVRLQTNLPPVDRSIASGEPLEIDGLQIGARLRGGGAFGEVRVLVKSGEVVGRVKKIRKSRAANTHGLKRVSQEIEIMELVSSAQWVHPNVIKMVNIHHSETHTLYQMPCGSSQDLYTRLRKRDSEHSPLCLLIADKARAICWQLLSALRHLHVGPQIVHRDIKPENVIILLETGDDIRIAIADFDAAMIQPPVPYHGIVGTYPLMAPEILLREVCNPYVADVWSTGVVFLEVACAVGILEKTLSLRRLMNQADPRAAKMHQKKMTASIHQFFTREGSTNQLLSNHHRPELSCSMGWLEVALPGMLNVIVDSRSTSSEALRAFCSVVDKKVQC